jgi:acyl transferase domain-containing protein
VVIKPLKAALRDGDKIYASVSLFVYHGGTSVLF